MDRPTPRHPPGHRAALPQLPDVPVPLTLATGKSPGSGERDLRTTPAEAKRAAHGRDWRVTVPSHRTHTHTHKKLSTPCALCPLKQNTGETAARGGVGAGLTPRRAGRLPRGASCRGTHLPWLAPEPQGDLGGGGAGKQAATVGGRQSGGPGRGASAPLSPRSPSPADREPAAARGEERGRRWAPPAAAVPGPGSFSPQVAPSRPPPREPLHHPLPGRARPQGRTLAPQPPLLEPEDADLGENVHQVAVAEPAVLAGAVPPPAGRGPVPVLLPRLPLLADQAAGDGRCHGCSPARPRRPAPRRAGGKSAAAAEGRSAPAGTHPRGRGRAGASSGPRRGCSGAPPPPSLRPAGAAAAAAGHRMGAPPPLPPCPGAGDTCSGGRVSAGGVAAPSGAERAGTPGRAALRRVGSGRVRPAASPPGAAPQPRAAAAARSPAPAIAAAGAATAASCRLPPDDCQVLQKSASGESNLLLRGEL